MLGEILRRGTGDEPRLAELARHEIVRARRPDADREVEPLLHQIHHAVGERYVEAHFRMPGHELGNRRRDVAHAEIHRGGQADGAARHDRRAGSLLLGLAQIGEELHRALVKGAPAFGEAYAPRGAVEEPGLQMAFQLGDVAGSCGSREAQPVRRLGKAARFNDLGEHLDGGEAVHRSILSRVVE